LEGIIYSLAIRRDPISPITNIKHFTISSVIIHNHIYPAISMRIKNNLVPIRRKFKTTIAFFHIG